MVRMTSARVLRDRSLRTLWPQQCLKQATSQHLIETINPNLSRWIPTNQVERSINPPSHRWMTLFLPAHWRWQRLSLSAFTSCHGTQNDYPQVLHASCLERGPRLYCLLTSCLRWCTKSLVGLFYERFRNLNSVAHRYKAQSSLSIRGKHPL